MADIAAVPISLSQDPCRAVLREWGPMAAGDVGEPVRVPLNADMTIHIYGTMGPTVLIEGTLETAATPTNWMTLNDGRGPGNALSTLVALLAVVHENVVQIRPRCTGTGGAVIVRLLARAP